ncbi:MAG: hypothetical protein U1F53_20840 [Burkholderiaceae bacterium]
MKTAHAAAGALLLCAAGLAVAQTMYRCGNTFSQKPCGDSATAVKVPGASASSAASPGATSPGGSTSQAACTRAAIGARPSERLRVESVEFGGTDVIQYAGSAVAAKVYRISLAETAADGSSLGYRSATCYMSEDGQRVLRVVN